MPKNNNLNIKPKLGNATKSLPSQPITPENIKKLAKQSAPTSKKTKPPKKKKGRPKRAEPIKRLGSDIPAALYEKVKKEIDSQGYSLNGFLARVIREYFDRKEKQEKKEE